jgi:threonine dehydrogenase-like Zn-dependent dehydrogenase
MNNLHSFDRMEKLAALITSGRIDASKLITHRYEGLEHAETALMLMKDTSRPT